VATLCPTSLQHGTTSARRHASTKPVLAGTAAIVRLKGALHVILLIGPLANMSGAALLVDQAQRFATVRPHLRRAETIAPG
jgi:hypothetical protein